LHKQVQEQLVLMFNIWLLQVGLVVEQIIVAMAVVVVQVVIVLQ
jgi:hypothetical protein